MDPHPDYSDTDLPRRVTIGKYTLTPLSPDQTEEDYAAVMAAAPLLGGFFGDWPSGLTLEENRIDLAWHEREFTTRRSFSWIIRTAEGAYIGCFYLFPDIGQRGRTEAALWLCDISDRTAVARQLCSDLRQWLAGVLAPQISLTWVTSPSL